MLREQIAELKGYLNDKSAPFGVDLLIPQVGGSARKTNYDYTKGKLDTLVDIIIDSGAKLFVSAVGVPPKAVVDRLHKHGILYMNMIDLRAGRRRRWTHWGRTDYNTDTDCMALQIAATMVGLLLLTHTV
jgi:NAD(P)H-dependent flavin oxidoreductase YrpB (nitropropane dioxygenase family)